mmetsp:Transcript_5158/g.7144  ORF Transcript_5158/g.7144 Transcript_5158/m.7144 type:complete len:107 (-) Transcript_5158:449-769(-)|eukprot:CAMPEP_0117738602 /NCGR_PEP_ID=MMETSP0947-20121206/3233_1 /TAXON_ID=44440 /ORGANISM="Chattonella subsalsa, Strain CCMP2191" /LENGTH=106 /DNA_ID=CAMNT_0005554335 /DNA_START=24 /DNA_END=344 /DNA_ORIENTATION=+
MFTIDKDDRTSSRAESQKDLTSAFQSQHDDSTFRSEGSGESKNDFQTSVKSEEEDVLEPWKQHPNLSLPGSVGGASLKSHRSARSKKRQTGRNGWGKGSGIWEAKG